MRIDLVGAVGIAAAVGMILAANTSMAGDYGCRSGDCYTQVRQPDVYGVVERPVVIAPAHTTVIHTPAAILDRVQRVVHKDTAVFVKKTAVAPAPEAAASRQRSIAA